MSNQVRESAKRLLRVVAPDPQTLTLLRAGARAVEKSAPGLLTLWDGWTAPLVRTSSAVFRRGGEEIDPPLNYPRVSLDVDDPVAAIVAAPEFPGLSQRFNSPDAAERSLVSSDTQALLYAFIRNQQPECVIEIGTYRASTSKVICRALHANQRGQLHTVDPFHSWPIMRLVRRWPEGLRERLRYYPMSSMDFFEIAFFQGLTSELIFIDGNHDYPYVLFDLQNAARLLRPGGFIAIDNISQAGPFRAAGDFLRDHPSWRECGHTLDSHLDTQAFDLKRSTIAGTDLCVIRAPLHHIIGRHPATEGPRSVSQAEVNGITLSLARPATGTLCAQFIVRVREPVMSEDTVETQTALDAAAGPVRVPLNWSFTQDEMRLERTIELWLGWSGDNELELTEPPTLY
jgi:predicted O-methyltransferase YrrM